MQYSPSPPATGILSGAAAVGLAPVAAADPPYKNCTQAHDDGRYNTPSDDAAYRDELDRDGDGYACEPKPQ